MKKLLLVVILLTMWPVRVEAQVLANDAVKFYYTTGTLFREYDNSVRINKTASTHELFFQDHVTSPGFTLNQIVTRDTSGSTVTLSTGWWEFTNDILRLTSGTIATIQNDNGNLRLDDTVELNGNSLFLETGAGAATSWYLRENGNVLEFSYGTEQGEVEFKRNGADSEIEVDLIDATDGDFSDDLTVGDVLTVNNDATISDNLTVTGTATMTEGLTVTGVTRLNGEILTFGGYTSPTAEILIARESPPLIFGEEFSTVTKLETFGDSITDDASDYPWSDYVADETGYSWTDHAVGGTTLEGYTTPTLNSSYYEQILRAGHPTTGTLRMALFGTNNSRYYKNESLMLKNFERGLGAAIVAMTVPSDARDHASSVTLTGTWATTNTWTAQRYSIRSSTLNSSATTTVRGRTVYVGATALESGGGQVSLIIDGTTHGPYSLTDAYSGTFGNNKVQGWNPMLLRVTGLHSGDHTVTVQVTGAGICQIDWIAGSSRNYSYQLPASIIAGPIRSTDSDQTYLDALRSINDIVARTVRYLAADGLNVHYVSVIDAYDASTMSTVDGVHPKAWGQRRIAGVMMNAFSDIGTGQTYGTMRNFGSINITSNTSTAAYRVGGVRILNRDSGAAVGVGDIDGHSENLNLYANGNIEATVISTGIKLTAGTDGYWVNNDTAMGSYYDGSNGYKMAFDASNLIEINSGAMVYRIGAASEFAMSTTAFYPVTTDANSSGRSGNRWSDVFAVDGDFSGSVEAVYFQITAASSPPVSPSLGAMYADTDDNELYFYNGTTWEPISP